MTDLRKAAQMALDWRDKNSELLFELGGWDFIFEINDWSQSIRGALAQPEQEHSEQWWKHEVSNAWAEGYEKGRLQREWQGLTDEEMMMIYGQSHEGKKYSLGRAIEAKLKEKNT